MVDFHTHILPKIDDGSKSIEQSLDMLHMLYRQGVRQVVASSHYYAYKKSIEQYLKDRYNSYATIKPYLDNSCPKIILGAEVLYFSGIGKCKSIRKLRIQGTNRILLEMPFESWNKEIIKDVEMLIENMRLEIVLAHVERYIGYKGNKKYIQYLLNIGVKLQVNNEVFKSFIAKRWVIRQIKQDNIFAFGSDCHNTNSRKPNWNYLNKYCNKKLENYIKEVSRYSI